MTSPSFDSRESTTLSPRWLQYGHFTTARLHAELSPMLAGSPPPLALPCAPALGSSRRRCRPGDCSTGTSRGVSAHLRRIGEPPHAGHIQSGLRREKESEQER